MTVLASYYYLKTGHPRDNNILGAKCRAHVVCFSFVSPYVDLVSVLKKFIANELTARATFWIEEFYNLTTLQSTHQKEGGYHSVELN